MLNKFNFKGRDVRVVEIDGQPWWVAADVCRALGYSMRRDGHPNTTQAINHLGADEKQTIYRRQAPTAEMRELFRDTTASSMAVITESGLYKLTMRSDKPEAREFQDWVTREVLPAIRRTGGYLKNFVGAPRLTKVPARSPRFPSGAHRRP